MAEDMNAAWVMASFNQGNYAQALSKYERLANDNPDGKSSATASAEPEPAAAAAGCARRAVWACGRWADLAGRIGCARKSASEQIREKPLTAVDCAGPRL